MNHIPMSDRIREKLTLAFAPVKLEVVDDSARHAGHAGNRPGHAPSGGETHFSVHIVSAAFAGLNKVAQHRAVYAVLESEMQTQIHALELETSAP